MKDNDKEVNKDDQFFEPRTNKGSMGFYMTVLLSSFAVINIWRFPHIVIQNGGGAFLYVYFFLASTIGASFVMAELLIAKISQQNMWLEIQRWTNDRMTLSVKYAWLKKPLYRFLQRLSETTFLVSLLVVAYYTVISAWALSSLGDYILSLVWGAKDAVSLTNAESFIAAEDSFINQFIFALVHLSLCYLCVRRGIRRGLERLALGALVVFLGLVLFICFQSLTLPNAIDAIRFLLYPDFTQVTYASLNQAFGHMFLSLGLGFGMISSLGGFFKKKQDVTSAGSKIMTASMVMSGFSVLMICPLVIGAPYAVFGPKLLFQTLPQLILKFPEGPVLLIAFYICFYILALVTSAGMLQVLISNLNERWKWPYWRMNSARILQTALAFIVLLVLFPILSTTLWRHFRWFGGVSLLETADGVLVNYILPILALSLALTALFILPYKLVKNEFVGPDIDQEISQFFPIWKAIIMVFAPLFILLAFVLRLLDPF